MNRQIADRLANAIERMIDLKIEEKLISSNVVHQSHREEYQRDRLHELQNVREDIVVALTLA